MNLMRSLLARRASDGYLGGFFAMATAVVSLTLGLSVIVGWHSHVPGLIQIAPELVPMQYNTALGFVLLATGLLLAITGQYRRVATAISITLLILGTLALSEYLFGTDLHIDQLFMEHYIQDKTSHPGRMAPNTALCFLLAGLAIFIAIRMPDDKSTPVWVCALGAIIMSLGAIALTGYLAGIETAYGWGQWTDMAVHTAFGFIIMGLGLIAHVWHKSRNEGADTPCWYAIPAGIGSMTMTISLWQALDAAESQLPAVAGPVAARYADEGILIYGILLTIALVAAIRHADTSRKRLLIAARAEAARNRSESYARAIIDAVSDGIVSTDANGIIETFNPAAERVFGYKAGEVIGSSIHTLVSGPLRNSLEQAGISELAGREVTGHRKDGSTFPMVLSLSAIHGSVRKRFTGIVRDITEHKQMLAQMEKMAYFDSLTGLPNRTLYYDRLQQALTQARRDNGRIAVLFLDLDDFKPINDELGHEYGDRALVDVAERLQQCVRQSDTVSRLGGDEFSIILGSIDDEDAACGVAEKIIANISQPMRFNGSSYCLGCSIGICVSDQDCSDVESIMSASDSAMYLAKRSGKNRYQIHRQQ